MTCGKHHEETSEKILMRSVPEATCGYFSSATSEGFFCEFTRKILGGIPKRDPIDPLEEFQMVPCGAHKGIPGATLRVIPCETSG